MFNSQGSRVSFFFFLLLASIVLVTVGHWAFAGILGGIVVVVAVLAHIVATLFSPHVMRWADTGQDLFMVACVTLVGVIVGCITFGWWGIAYGVGSICGFLLSRTVR